MKKVRELNNEIVTNGAWLPCLAIRWRVLCYSRGSVPSHGLRLHPMAWLAASVLLWARLQPLHAGRSAGVTYAIRLRPR